MKRQIFTILLASLIITSLTYCSDGSLTMEKADQVLKEILPDTLTAKYYVGTNLTTSSKTSLYASNKLYAQDLVSFREFSTTKDFFGRSSISFATDIKQGFEGWKYVRGEKKQRNGKSYFNVITAEIHIKEITEIQKLTIIPIPSFAF